MRRSLMGAAGRRRTRSLAMAVLAAPLMAGGSLGLTQPAAAEPTAQTADLSIAMLSSKLAADSTAKSFAVQIHNAGPDPATGLSVQFDVSALDTAKLNPTTLSSPCAATVPIDTCDLSEIKELPAGGSINLSLRVEHLSGAGPAGSITVALSAATPDPDATNNVSTTPVEIVGHGADIVAYGGDVRYSRQAGGTLDWVMANAGDEVADGLRFTAVLPSHVAFVERETYCTYSADGRTADCTLPDVILRPGESFAPNFDAGMQVVVDIDDPESVTLTGGTVTGEAIRSVPVEAARTLHATTPSGFTITAGAAASLDVDLGDNAFRFSVLVEAAPAQPQPPEGLPATGARAGLVAAVGLAAVAFGVVMVATARRRSRRHPLNPHRP